MGEDKKKKDAQAFRYKNGEDAGVWVGGTTAAVTGLRLHHPQWSSPQQSIKAAHNL